MPAWSPPSAISSVARIIPSLTTPRSFAAPSVRPSGISAPGRATATVWPAATFGAPQTIVDRLGLADLDRADAQAVGVRVLDGLEHVADDVVLGRGRAVAEPALDLRAGQRQARGQLLGPETRGRSTRAAIRAGRASADAPELLEEAQVVVEDRRRSGMPWRSIAIRSMPMPNAKPLTRSGS